MFNLKQIALGFLAVLTLVVAALAVQTMHPFTHHQLLTGLAGLGMLFGMVTVTYKNTTGTTTPPTAIQSSTHNTIVATIAASADADAGATVTHNLNLSAADLASGWPTVVYEPISGLAQTSRWFSTSHYANYLVITKGNTAGGGAAAEQLKVTVSRPHTIVR